MVINARTDIYLMPIGPEATDLGGRSNACARIERQGGLTCSCRDYAIGNHNETGEDSWRASEHLASPGCPSLDELEKMGVARVSAGSSAMRSAMGAFRRVAKDWLAHGTYESLTQVTIPYAELNSMMARKPS